MVSNLNPVRSGNSFDKCSSRCWRDNTASKPNEQATTSKPKLCHDNWRSHQGRIHCPLTQLLLENLLPPLFSQKTVSELWCKHICLGSTVFFKVFFFLFFFSSSSSSSSKKGLDWCWERRDKIPSLAPSLTKVNCELANLFCCHGKPCLVKITTFSARGDTFSRNINFVFSHEHLHLRYFVNVALLLIVVYSWQYI